MYKYIFCDLDGTLLNDLKKIPKANIEAINKAKREGVTFLLSTGRVPFCFEEYGKDIDISSYSACNGGIISINGKIIKDECMSIENAKALIEYGIEHGLNERIFTRDRLYLVNTNKVLKIFLRYRNSRDISHAEARKLAEEEKIYKVCFCADHRELLDKAKKDILDSGLPLEACFSGTLFLEFNNKGISKGQGIKDFCALTGTDIADTIAIGDNENDYSMIKVAGLGACPANSAADIKEIAGYIAEKDNNNGAIAEIIDRFVFKQ